MDIVPRKPPYAQVEMVGRQGLIRGRGIPMFVLPPSTLKAIRAFGLEGIETRRENISPDRLPLPRREPAVLHPNVLKAMAVAAARRERQIPMGIRFSPFGGRNTQAAQMLHVSQMPPQERGLLVRFGEAKSSRSLFR